MTRIVPIGDGREIVVSADLGRIRVSIWANHGSLGLELDKKQAAMLRTSLLQAIVEIEKTQPIR